jgi:hypothetical protein
MYARKLINSILTNFQVRITSINLMLMQKLTKDPKQRIIEKSYMVTCSQSHQSDHNNLRFSANFHVTISSMYPTMLTKTIPSNF